MEGYFNKWVQAQEEALQEINRSFSEVPRFYVELQQKELRTLVVLSDLGEKIFKEYDPNEVLFKKEIYEVRQEENCLRIYLPFADRDELCLEQEQRELAVGVRNEKRRFPIPPGFAGKEIDGAKFEDGYLSVRFSK